jgi:hypothetical protein
MKTKFDIWKEYWDELDDSTKISIRNEYCREHNPDEEIFSFDEEFFETFFSESKAIEVARAVYFGNIQSWNDDYIKFNGYANLESMSSYDAVKDTEDYYLNSIFENDSCWCDEIDEDEVSNDFREQHLNYFKEQVIKQLPDIDPDDAEYWFDDNWDDDCDEANEKSDDELVKQCVEYLSDPENR